MRNVSVLVAIGVGADGYRQVLRIAEGGKEDKAGWRGFLRHLKERGLKGVRLVISDACLGLVEALGETLPEAQWQRKLACQGDSFKVEFPALPPGLPAACDRQAQCDEAAQGGRPGA